MQPVPFADANEDRERIIFFGPSGFQTKVIVEVHR